MNIDDLLLAAGECEINRDRVWVGQYHCSTHCVWFRDEGDVKHCPALEAALAVAVEALSFIDTPQTGEFLEAVKVEVAHQRKRWGDAHDANKSPADWFWTLGYLAQKALDPEKRLHHLISSAALLANWYRREVKP